MTGSALAGLLLSTSLAACGGSAGREAAAEFVREPTVVVREVPAPRPPAELLRCPAPVQGLPESGGAIIPGDWRAGIVRLAKSRGELADQVARLILFHTGEPCPDVR